MAKISEIVSLNTAESDKLAEAARDLRMKRTNWVVSGNAQIASGARPVDINAKIIHPLTTLETTNRKEFENYVASRQAMANVLLEITERFKIALQEAKPGFKDREFGRRIQRFCDIMEMLGSMYNHVSHYNGGMVHLNETPHKHGYPELSLQQINALMQVKIKDLLDPDRGLFPTSIDDVEALIAKAQACRSDQREQTLSEIVGPPAINFNPTLGMMAILHSGDKSGECGGFVDSMMTWDSTLQRSDWWHGLNERDKLSHRAIEILVHWIRGQWGTPIVHNPGALNSLAKDLVAWVKDPNSINLDPVIVKQGSNGIVWSSCYHEDRDIYQNIREDPKLIESPDSKYILARMKIIVAAITKSAYGKDEDGFLKFDIPEWLLLPGYYLENEEYMSNKHAFTPEELEAIEFLEDEDE